jgi:hypothetical protein
VCVCASALFLFFTDKELVYLYFQSKTNGPPMLETSRLRRAD